MKISVVIPALNEEKYIGKLLDCLVSQTFKDFEVIVSDGNSEDKTRDVVLSYMDTLDISFVTSDIRSPSHQRNHGAEHAKYEYLIFLDSDVTLSESFLADIVTVSDRGFFEGLGGSLYPDPPKVSYKIVFFIYRIFVLLTSSIRPFVTGAFMFVKKEAFEKIKGFNEDYLVFEDVDFFRRIKRAGYKVGVSPRLKLLVSMRRVEKRGFWGYLLDALIFGISHIFKGPVKRMDKLRKKYKFGNF